MAFQKSSILIYVVSCFYLLSNVKGQNFVINGGGIATVQTQNIGGAQLPVLVTATITQATLRAPGQRVDFPRNAAVENRMTLMQRRPDDDRGHMIASQLGGTGDVWNLMPQARGCNQNIGSRNLCIAWFDLETQVARYVRSGRGSVQWLMTLQYRNPAEQRRPSHFRVVASFFNPAGRLVDTTDTQDVVNGHDQPLNTPRRQG